MVSLQRATGRAGLVVSGGSDVSAINGVTDHECVEYTGNKVLTEQGFKVWSKRKCGVSYATKKAKAGVDK